MRRLATSPLLCAVWAVALLTGPACAVPPARAQDDVADVRSQDLRAGGDANMRYFLIGAGPASKPPSGGYHLLVVMPGGGGGADFHPFVKRIYKHALPASYLVAQPVAVEWSPGQAEQLVWPTERVPWPEMKFSTEAFVEAVISDVRKRYPIDPRYVFTLGWSSSGPPAYAISLRKPRSVTGAFIAMSVFKPDQLPPLESARGCAYYLLHSPQDFIPIRMAERARDSLAEAGANVKLATYEGGHGWHGDVFGTIRAGIEWLEKNHGEPKRKG